jgi:Glycosyl transferase family 2
MEKHTTLRVIFLLVFLLPIQVVLIWSNELTINALYLIQGHRDYDKKFRVNHGSVAICSVVKFESAYLDEWIDYYLSIGFNRIFLYDNSEQHALLNWLEKSDKSGDVSVVLFPGQKVQRNAYASCAKTVRQRNFSWVFFVDADEFLVMKQHDRVDQFLSEYCLDGALSINWRVFGTSGQMQYRPIPVLKRFQLRLPDDDPLNRFIKSFVRTDAMKVLLKFYRSPHVFPLKENLHHRDTDGNIVNSSWHNGPTDLAAIYHYKYKSYEEYYRNKVPRGSVFYGGSKGSTEFKWDSLPNGSIFDDLAWKTLLRHVPKYKFYD